MREDTVDESADGPRAVPSIEDRMPLAEEGGAWLWCSLLDSTACFSGLTLYRLMFFSGELSIGTDAAEYNTKQIQGSVPWDRVIAS